MKLEVLVLVAGLAFVIMISGCTTEEPHRDINVVMSVWEIKYPDSVEACLKYRGTWHNEPDWWGCEGANPILWDGDCSSKEALECKRMCESISATWVCGIGGIYCKY